MESHEVIKQAFEKTSPKQVAAEMGLSLSLVYKWAQPTSETGSGSRNPLDRVLELLRLTRHLPLIEWLCRRAGGYFVRNPTSYCKEGFEVMPAANEIVQQFAGLLSVISQAALDNKITGDESRQIRRHWDELKSYTEGFVRCCEEGDFDEIKRQLGK
ncbi:MAG: phage regulatory CII family protein [Verrucomicrobiales bacterium]